MPEITKPGFYIYLNPKGDEPDRNRVAFIYSVEKPKTKTWKILKGPYKRRYHAVEDAIILA